MNTTKFPNLKFSRSNFKTKLTLIDLKLNFSASIRVELLQHPSLKSISHWMFYSGSLLITIATKNAQNNRIPNRWTLAPYARNKNELGTIQCSGCPPAIELSSFFSFFYFSVCDFSPSNPSLSAGTEIDTDQTLSLSLCEVWEDDEMSPACFTKSEKST